RVLKDYMQVAGETLRKELAITVADMETGSYETALTRMETRINSALTSSVLRGLIGAVRGNDEIAYFKMLSYDLKQQEVEMLKKTAQKAIPKINTCSMLLMLCILGMFMGVLVLDLFANSGAIF
ncbi:MAG: secretion protein F, partial [Oscillospiraceae bacterium]